MRCSAGAIASGVSVKALDEPDMILVRRVAVVRRAGPGAERPGRAGDRVPKPEEV